ncbi:MAG: MCP four helix bundle domain-containing protein, partial [Anaerotignaceae bacterium]
MKNIKISSKLFLSFSIIIVLLIGIGLISIRNVRSVDRTTDGFADTHIPTINSIWTARESLITLQRYTLQKISETDAASSNALANNINAEVEEMINALNDITAYVPQFSSQVDRIRGLLPEVNSLAVELDVLSSKNTAQARAQAFTIYKNTYVPLFDEIISILTQINNEELAYVDERQLESAKVANTGETI